MNNMMNQMNNMNNMNMKNEGGDMNNPFAMMMNQMQVIFKLYLQGAVSGNLIVCRYGSINPPNSSNT